jgi:hypothetical protein
MDRSSARENRAENRPAYSDRRYKRQGEREMNAPAGAASALMNLPTVSRD